MLNALTIDVEDYFQVSAFEGCVDRKDWDHYPSRVVANTHRILRLFERRQVRGTFYILGWVARRFPGLVKDIAKDGHEIACHSFWHRLIYRLTPDEFRADLREARDVLENASGQRVDSFRAPSYSITNQSLWSLDILRDEGFRFDSSIFPIYHDRYGIPNAERYPHRLTNSHGELWEFPPTVYSIWKFNLPVSGGGYFRLYPARFTAHCFRKINEQGKPFVFYLHPWEVDPDQPRLPVNRLTRFRHYVNLDSTAQKLDWLLPRFRFGTVKESLVNYAPAAA